MTATNKTLVYELPIFVGTDKPTWLGDFNGAMNTIETGLVDAKNSSTTVIQTANTALNIANSAKADVAAATSASNNAVAIATTAKNTADAATATATQAATTANTANTNATNAVTTANAASANASQALTTVNGINTNPPAVFGVARATNDNEGMPASPVIFAMTPVSQQGMTWVSSSNGYRVDKAGVYFVTVEGGVQASDTEGALWITRNRAGTIANLRYAICPAGTTEYTVNVTSILTLNTGDIITVSGDKALFYGGPASLNGIELNITRLGA